MPITIETIDSKSKWTGLSPVQWEQGKLWLETQPISHEFDQGDRTWLATHHETLEQMQELTTILNDAG